MRQLLNRKFTVQVPLETAWEYLSNVGMWPSWAKHIRRVELQPVQPLSLKSSGSIHLKNGIRSIFKMTEFNPLKNWKWVGPFLGLTIHYDHRFRSVDVNTTEIVFDVQAEGIAVNILGPVFAAIYRRSLDRAIPNLVQELHRRV